MSWYATKKASKLPSLDKSKILVFDTETTRLESNIDEILQITILDGSGSELFNSYIKPAHHKSWPLAEKVNHINYEQVKDMPTFSEVRDKIQDLFNNAKLVVGYNINFDINFVEAAGIVVSGQVFDVMTAFASYRAAVDHTITRKCRLVECAQYFHHSYSPHNSFDDASVTLECFNSLINDPRFTTYKPKEKKQVQEESIPEVSKPKTSFTIQISTHRRHNIAFFGLFLSLVVEGVMYFTSSSIINNAKEYVCQIKNLILNLALSWSTDSLKCILYIAFGLGCLLIIIGVIQMLIRLPRFIVNKIKHLISKSGNR